MIVIVHNVLIDSINSRRASSWTVQPVPRVRGRLPLNIDIMLDWLRHRDEDVGRLFINLERIHGKTFNSRVFGEDQILSLDPAVFDYVMSSGFEEFEKGEELKGVETDGKVQSSEVESVVCWAKGFSILMVTSTSLRVQDTYGG